MQQLNARKQVLIRKENQQTCALGDLSTAGLDAVTAADLTSRFASYDIVFETVTLKTSGAGIQVAMIPDPILEEKETFFLCSSCGKVF